MDKRALIVIVAVAIVIALAVSYAFNLTSSKDSEGNDGTVVEMDVTSNGDGKVLTLTASADKFNLSTPADDLLVYYFALDGYVDSDDKFDYTKFYEDMEKEGAYDEDLQEYLPSNAEKITGFSVNVSSSTDMTVSFSKTGTYAAYIVVLGTYAVTDGTPVAVSLYDIPEESYLNSNPRITVENKIYENLDGSTFVLKAVNTEFSTDIKATSITLSGALSDLQIESVSYVSADTVEIKTSGFVTRGTSSTGYIDLLGDAVSCGYELSANVTILNNEYSIDESSFEMDGSNLVFDMTVSRSTYDNYGSMTLLGNEILLSSVAKEVAEDYAVLRVSLPLSSSDIEECIGLLDGELLKFEGGQSIDTTESDICISGAVISAYLDKYVSNSDGLTLTIPIYVYSGSVDNLTSGDVSFISENESTVSVAYSAEYGTYCATVKIPGFDGDIVSGTLVLTGGKVETPWGTDAGDVSIPFSAPVKDSSGDNTRTMINELYKHMKFQKVMGGINIATMGIGAVVDILGATGVIDMRSATDIAVAEINLKCDEIKNMLADQSQQLEKMNKKLNEIKEMLKEQRLLTLSNIYAQYLSVNNDLANDIVTFSTHIKTDVWDLVKNNSDSTFYVYVTEEGNFSIMQGDFYTEQFIGQTIDGKNILPAYTIGVSLDYGLTFADANVGTSFSKNTESLMVGCLKDYLVDEGIVTDGKYSVTTSSGETVTYTADQVAQKIYDCIVVKFTELRAHGTDGDTILHDYRKYTETMASLIVTPSMDISVNPDLRSNPILASQEIMKACYNFETEAYYNLQSMNDSTTMFLYSYTMVASGIEQLQGGGSDSVEKHYNAAMQFLSGHRGYHQDCYVNKDYCYVTDSYIKAKDLTISVQATYHTTDEFRRNVSNSPTDITPMKTAQQLGIPSKYVNTDQLKKILENYNRLKSQGVTNLDVKSYLQEHTGSKYTGFVSNNLITDFEGGEIYNDGRHVKLYSNVNLVSPGHGAQLVDSGHIYEIKGTIDKSGFLKQFKAYSSNVYGKIAYKGDLFNIGTGKFYDNVCNVKGFIYAVGFFCKHVGAWKYDEAAVLTPEKSLENCTVSVEKTGFKFRTYSVNVTYTVFQLTS